MRARSLSGALLALALIVGAAVPAYAEGAEVTSGRFVTLPGGEGLGYEISGVAVMVRAPARGGTTAVMAIVRGLEGDTTYPTHVHNAPCSASPAGGGHYQHQVDGSVDAVNEIWPTVETGHGGVGIGMARHDHRARAEAQSIVIHYPQDTAIRLACVDLV